MPTRMPDKAIGKDKPSAAVSGLIKQARFTKQDLSGLSTIGNPVAWVQRGFSSLAPLGSCWTPLGWVCLVRPVGCVLVTVTVTVHKEGFRR